MNNGKRYSREKGSFHIVDETKEKFVVAYTMRRGNDFDGTTEVKDVCRNIPRKNVQVVANVIQDAKPSDFERKSIEEPPKLGCHYIGEYISRHFDFNEFFDGSEFKWNWFQGTKTTYEMYYHFPLKILEEKNLITYHKNGKVSIKQR